MADEHDTPADDAAAVPVDPQASETAEPSPPVEAAPTPPEGSASETDDPAIDTQPEGEPLEGQAPKSSPAQERISQLVQQRNEAEARALLAEQERDRLQGDVRPVDYDDLDYEDQQRIDTKSSMREVLAEEKEVTAQREANAAAQARLQLFQAKVDGVRERMPDIDQAIDSLSDRQVTESMADLIADSDTGPEIMYYLAKNPAVASEIANLPAHRQGLEIARLEQRVRPPDNARKVSTAPAPPPTVGAGSAPDGVPLREMKAADFRAAYNKRVEAEKAARR